MKKLLVCFFIMYSFRVFAQKELPIEILKNNFKNTNLVLNGNALENLGPLEMGELPLIIKKVTVFKKSLEIYGMTCLNQSSLCIPIGEFLIFKAKKKKNIIYDTANLYYKINSLTTFPEDTSSNAYKDFYNQTFKIKVNFDTNDFIYFYNKDYYLAELNLFKLKKSLKKKLR